TAGSDGNGAVTPASSSITHGQRTTFTLTPDVGYHIDAVSGCDGTLDDDQYTTGIITDACAVTARFAVNQYPVTATGTAHGAIVPGIASVDHGQSATFTLTPETGHSIAAVSGCDGTLNGNEYTTGAVTGACAVSASFVLNQY